MNRRQALRALAAAGVAGAGASACGGTQEPAEEALPTSNTTIRVGMLVPQTGGYKPIGDEIINGFQLYLGLHGNRLGGHLVDLQIEDEGETARSGKAGFDRLLKRNVLALTGVVNSQVMLDVRSAVRNAKIPLIGSNASPANLQGEVYIWRTSFVNDECGLALGPYVASQVKGTVAMIAPQYAAGQDVIDGFREGFGRRDERLTDPIWTGAATNPPRGYFTKAMDELRRTDPAAVFCFFAGAAAVEFVRAYKESGLRAKLYAPGFLTEGATLTELGSAADGIITALNYSADLPNGTNRTFTSAYRKAYDSSPTTYAMASYDAAQVLGKAIQLAGPAPSSQQVNLMLGRVGQIASPRGAWQFNQSRTPQQRWYLRQVRRDGRVLSNVIVRELNTLG